MTMRSKLFLTQLLLLLLFSACSQTDTTKIDTLEFQTGYPTLKTDALEQLKKYPSPRYLPNNNFIRIFNWMDPYYAGGATQTGIKNSDAIIKGTEIQEELGMNWNYCLVIPNSVMATNDAAYKNINNPIKAYTDLANKHPEIPLGIITLWVQISPKSMGYSYNRPNISRQDLPEQCYLKDAAKQFKWKSISFAAPDSLFIIDGKIQRKYLQTIVKHLTRPINIINENGEEPPGVFSEKFLMQDERLVNDKNNLNIKNWEAYTATKKKHIRGLYTSQFMDSIPELKNTWFTIYQNEGGPIDRSDWSISKSISSKINGNYYSTADIYTRTADNWKLWKGPWHGWKWLNDGRKVEIKNGDRFCSPFIAAGWAFDPEKDMRPAQWLGLLKCMTVVGAEFFYTGYFNEKKPFSKPENYIWQAAMPSYAQAITTHFAEIFRHGNVLFDKNNEAIVTYPVADKDVLVAVRKHDSQKQYIIAATVQPSSNTEKFPLEKKISIEIDGDNITLNARRQGSVYFLDKSATPYIFYQLDKWHQYEHPSRWRKDLIYEAEVLDTASIQNIIKTNYTGTENNIDLTNFESYITLDTKQWSAYSIYERDIEHLAEK